jgi:hypothetical protein
MLRLPVHAIFYGARPVERARLKMVKNSPQPTRAIAYVSAYESVMQRLEELEAHYSGVTDLARSIEAFAVEVAAMALLDLTLSYQAMADPAMPASEVGK